MKKVKTLFIFLPFREKSILSFLFVALVLISMTGCKPDAIVDLGTRASGVSFTMTPVVGRVNTYLLQATAQNAFGYQWNKGTGAFAKGKQTDTAYFPLHGTYTVQLRAYGRGGYDTASQQITITVDDLLSNPIFQQLTAKNWILNPADGSIIVGTEANPAASYGGGALADCQKDDVYTFSTALKLTYNAAGSTFNGGNLAPNYSCSTDRSYSNVAYTFAPGVTSGAGIATITLGQPVPTLFIGVTDISSNNYRIISMTPTAMVLRSGTTTETVHQFKFIAQ